MGAHPVAVFRTSYSQRDTLTGRSTWDAARPLRRFDASDFQGAVVIDPIVLKMQNLKMLELQVPATTAEYIDAEQTTESRESKLAAQTCLVLAGVSSGAQGSKRQEAAKHACDLASGFMAQYPSDPAVQESACQLIGNLAAEAGPSLISLASQVTAAMRR